MRYVHLLLLLSTLLTPVCGLEAPAKDKGRDGDGDGDWVTLKAGLEKVRREYDPALIVYVAPSDAGPEVESPAEPAPIEELLEVNRIKRVLRYFVRIRLKSDDLAEPYPVPEPEVAAAGKKGDRQAKDGAKPAPRAREEAPATGTRLGLVKGKSALVILSFREEVVLRHEEGRLPTALRFSKELTRIVKVNELYAVAARRAEKAINDSRYARSVGKQREAVLIIRPYEDEKLQKGLDPVALKAVEKLIGEYKSEAREAMKAADRLEAQRKFTEAIVAYDDVSKAYPFADIRKRASIRKGDIYRKMTLGF